MNKIRCHLWEDCLPVPSLFYISILTQLLHQYSSGVVPPPVRCQGMQWYHYIIRAEMFLSATKVRHSYKDAEKESFLHNLADQQLLEPIADSYERMQSPLPWGLARRICNAVIWWSFTSVSRSIPWLENKCPSLEEWLKCWSKLGGMISWNVVAPVIHSTIESLRRYLIYSSHCYPICI